MDPNAVGYKPRRCKKPKAYISKEAAELRRLQLNEEHKLGLRHTYYCYYHNGWHNSKRGKSWWAKQKKKMQKRGTEKVPLFNN